MYMFQLFFLKGEHWLLIWIREYICNKSINSNENIKVNAINNEKNK